MIVDSIIDNTNLNDSSLIFLEGSACVAYNYINKLVIKDYERDTIIKEIKFTENIIRLYYIHNILNNPNQLIVLTQNGNIYQYNLTNFELLDNLKLNETITQTNFYKKEAKIFVITQKKDLIVLGLIHGKISVIKNYKLKAQILEKEKAILEQQSQLSKTEKIQKQKNLDMRFLVSFGPDYLFVGCGDKNVYIVSLGEETCNIQKFCHHSIITCMTTDYDKQLLCVGDVNGRLTYYKNPIKNHNKDYSIFHWHSDQISTLEFANCGDMLLSGGNEGVIAIWYENGTKKDFCPRVQGKIVQLKTNEDSDKVMIKLHNNSIKIIQQTNFELINEINDIYIENFDYLKVSVNDSGDSHIKNDMVLTSGENTQQLIDNKGLLIKKPNLTLRNLTQSEDITEGSKLRILNVCFSCDRNWQAIVEGNLGVESTNFFYTRQKFFKVEKNVQDQTTFELVNSVDLPHSGRVQGQQSGIFSEQKISKSPIFQTWDDNGEYKLWNLGTSRLTGTAEWECFDTHKLYNETIQSIKFVNNENQVNAEIKLLIIQQKRFMIYNVTQKKIEIELSPLTEGEQTNGILFKDNKELVLQNHISAESRSEIIWIDLTVEEPLWSESIENVSQILQVSKEWFVIIVDVKDKQQSLIQLCNINVRIFVKS